jgi:L-ascorbate metabolism protein UlaG (beta-lactamase superfamily)
MCRCTPSFRQLLDHPRLEPFRRYEQRPAAGGPVAARFLGVTSLLFEDDETAILSDGFVSRPGITRVLVGRIGPDRKRIESTLKRLGRLGPDSIAAVFTGHSHYDHAMDAPVFAQLTGAVLLGSRSTANVGRGVGLPESALRVVGDGEALRFGKFELTFVESVHSPGDPFPGTIDKPLVPPARMSAWKTGTTYSVLIRRKRRTLLVHGSANYKPGALRDCRADVVYLGIGGLGRQKDDFVNDYWDEVVRATKAKRVILVHWDNFFRSLDKPLRPIPFFAKGMRHILRRAADDGVQVRLPVLWKRTDPFAGL